MESRTIQFIMRYDESMRLGYYLNALLFQRRPKINSCIIYKSTEVKRKGNQYLFVISTKFDAEINPHEVFLHH